MKLFYAPGACSLAVHIALRELGISFDPVSVDLVKYTTSDGTNYKSISPRGYVPLLELNDGSRHTEVASLLQYVADLEPHKNLIGQPGSARRLLVIEWLTFVSTELHKVFSPWLWHPETAESTRISVKAKLATRFDELNRLLGEQEFLAGDYSVADAYAFTIINWSNFLGIPLTKYPNLLAYMERIAARAAVDAAMRVEGLRK